MDLPSLTSPENLGWLLLLRVLFWLSRPVRPRQATTTPHLTQWLRARARLRRRPVRFRWLRFVLLMIAFTSSVIAFCGPTRGGVEGPRSLAVVMDVSGSLAAGDGASTWSEARQVLRDGLAQLPGSFPIRLAICGAGVAAIEGSAAEVLAALPEAPSGAGETDLAALATQLRGLEGEVAVWTITDGLGPTAPPRHGALSIVGEPRANHGFTAVEVDDRWPLREVNLVLELRSFDGAPRTLAVTAEGGVEPLTPVSVEVGPGASARVELSLVRTAGGRLRVHLVDHDDGFRLDDEVAVDLPVPPPADIAIHDDGSEGVSWVQTAAEVLAAETGGEVVRGAAAETAGFLLVDGGIFPQAAGSMRFLTFGTRAGSGELTTDDLVAQPRVIDWARDDPITRGLDLSGLTVETCLRRDFIGSGEALVAAEHGPLMVVDEGQEWTSVHAAFRLGDSNLPLLPAFPQLLRRCYSRSFQGQAEASLAPRNLLSPAESDLRRLAPEEAYLERPLGPVGRPGTSLVVPLLLLALAALAVRVYA